MIDFERSRNEQREKIDLRLVPSKAQPSTIKPVKPSQPLTLLWFWSH